MDTYQKLRFYYKLPLANALVMVALSIVITALMAHYAVNIPDAKYTRLLVRLVSPDAPVYFYSGLTVLSLFCSVFAIVFAVKSQIGGKYITLDTTSAIVPLASLSMKKIAIPYRQISRIQLLSIKKLKIILIQSTVGESRLSEKSFASPNEFTRFYLELQRRRNS